MIKIDSVHHPYYNKVHTGGLVNCAWPCRSPFIENNRYNLIPLWLSISVGLIFVCCISSLLTFVLNRVELIQPPHRFVAYICCCQIGMSVGFIIRLVAGHYRTVCFQPDSKPIQDSLLLMLRFQNSAPSVCSISFLFTYFFFFASVLWWWLLCLTWFFNDGLGWSSSMIDKYSQLYHFIAWFFPGIFSMLALTMSAVDGDPVTGLCLVGNINRQHLITFLLAPLCVFTCSGFFFLGCGFLSIIRCDESSANRSKLSIPVSPRTISTDTSVESAASSLPKLTTSNITKFFYGFLGLICSIPLCLTTGSIVYEMRWRSHWELASTCTCLNQIESNSYIPTPSILLYVLKYSGFFAMGIICGPWIWPMQTYNSWLGSIVRLLLCKTKTRNRDTFSKPKPPHICQAQQLYNTNYTITTSCQTSCQRQECLLDPPTINDSLIMSSLNPMNKCQHRFPISRLHEIPINHSIAPDAESYASYQSLSNYHLNQFKNPQNLYEFYKKDDVMSPNWPIFHS
uniref:G-protein coupled receptors family 2 profile 2 domain-containing protein n=2 Tax=Schmidtea mediterranea TaxID=79327 RepID=A0A1S6KMG8_SCHMD|nr:hypothetical protein Smed-fzd-5/8-2 [Schmidtea mediterranea]